MPQELGLGFPCKQNVCPGSVLENGTGTRKEAVLASAQRDFSTQSEELGFLSSWGVSSGS